MMRRGEGVPQALATGSMDAAVVAQERLTPRLVQGDPVGRQIAERLHGGTGEVGEAGRRVRTGPTAHVLQLLRQAPSDRASRRAGRPSTAAVPAVSGRSPRRAGSVGPTPPGCSRGHETEQPVGIEAEVRDEVDVISPSVEVVAGDITGVAAVRLAWRMGEGVPDRRRPAVLAGAAIDLIGRCRCAPEEARWEPGLDPASLVQRIDRDGHRQATIGPATLEEGQALRPVELRAVDVLDPAVRVLQLDAAHRLRDGRRSAPGSTRRRGCPGARSTDVVLPSTARSSPAWPNRRTRSEDQVAARSARSRRPPRRPAPRIG